MKPANLWIRSPLFVLALALGALNWGANPVSSQPQSEGGLQPFAVLASTMGPLTVTGAGHIDWEAILRAPCCYWPPRLM